MGQETSSKKGIHVALAFFILVFGTGLASAHETKTLLIAVISGFCPTKENFPPEKVHPFAGGSVVLPGIMVVAIKAYHSLLKLKEKADIILPLHDPDVLEMGSIPWSWTTSFFAQVSRCKEFILSGSNQHSSRAEYQ